MKASTVMILLAGSAVVAGLLTGAIGNAFLSVKSSLDGYFVSQRNGVVPFEGVWRDGHGICTVTNWMSVSSDSSPKIITTYLVAPKTSTASPGQLWFFAAASYANTPTVSIYPGQTNDQWRIEDSPITNNWPEISHQAELIYVSSIQKAESGRFEGQDIYARCRVRMWSGTTAYLEGDSWLLVQWLTNTATLLKWTTPQNK